MYKLLLTIIILFVLLPLHVYAIGIAVEPARLAVETTVDTEVTQVITVQNASADVSLFEAYVDTFEDVITVRPASFILESGDARQVSVILNTDKEQIITTNISIISKPVTDSTFSANGGVKVPLTAKITGENKTNNHIASIGSLFNGLPLTVILVIIVGLAAFIAGQKMKR